MNFDVPMRTSGAVDSRSLTQQSGWTKPAVDLKHATNQDFAPGQFRDARSPRNFSDSQNSQNLQNLQNLQNPRNSQSIQNTQYSQNSQNPRTPVPVSGSGTYLRKGQKIPVSEPFIRIALGWDVLNPACELDASSFMLGQDDKVLSDDWFIFYGQPNDPDGTVRYQVNQNGSDKALIDVEIARIRPEVRKIVFAVTIYEAIQKRLNFSMTRNVYGRILNREQQEIARFDLTDCSPQVTAMVIGELYRYKDTWKFNAVGSGVGRDLPGFCGMYGVNLE